MKYAPPIGQEAQGEDAHYIDGNPELGILGSPVPAAALEPVQRELVNVIRKAGLDPTGDDLTQLWQAICKIIGIKAPLATLLKAGLMQPDGKTTTVDEAGLLSALGGNLLLNSEEWMTESGEWKASVDGWHEITVWHGGDGAWWSNRDQNGATGNAYAPLTYLRYYHAGDTMPLVIGVAGVAGVLNSGGITTFGDLPTEADRDKAVIRWRRAGANQLGTGMTYLAGVGIGGGYEDGTQTALPATFYGASGALICSATRGVYTSNGAQGAVRIRSYNPAKAAGPLPTPALLSARSMAAPLAAKPATVNLYDPETGQGSVWREEDAPAQLAKGMITEAAWLEIRAARAAEEYAAWLADPETEAERFELLRQARDAKLAATDYLVAPDYPLTDEQRAAVTADRQALRDLPTQEGAPWDGGGELTPWPEEPAVTKVQEA